MDIFWRAKLQGFEAGHNFLDAIAFKIVFSRGTIYQTKFIIGFLTVTKQTVSDNINFVQAENAPRDPVFTVKNSWHLECLQCLHREQHSRTDALLITTPTNLYCCS